MAALCAANLPQIELQYHPATQRARDPAGPAGCAPHPRYEDTLLVQATLLNELAMPQPYPRVQLALFDTAGKLLGHRHFVPADYLPGGADPDQGMPVNQRCVSRWP